MWKKHQVSYFIVASAESYLNECLAVYQVVYGPNHQKTLDIQDELARLMVRTDRAEVGPCLYIMCAYYILIVWIFSECDSVNHYKYGLYIFITFQ